MDRRVFHFRVLLYNSRSLSVLNFRIRDRRKTTLHFFAAKSATCFESDCNYTVVLQHRRKPVLRKWADPGLKTVSYPYQVTIRLGLLKTLTNTPKSYTLILNVFLKNNNKNLKYIIHVKC